MNLHPNFSIRTPRFALIIGWHPYRVRHGLKFTSRHSWIFSVPRLLVARGHYL